MCGRQPHDSLQLGVEPGIHLGTVQSKTGFINLDLQNAMTGKTNEGVKEPTRIGEDLFNSAKRTYIDKLASGSHHTLALTKDGKIFAWGDPESGKIGRMLNTRNKNQQALRIEKVAAKNAKDIFCGNHHSFYINKKGQVFGWGLNNHGQLGIGHKDNTSIPTLVRKLEGQNVQMIAGGEHHTIAVTADGKVYCWGRNDEGQCGLGDLYGQHKRKRALEMQEKMLKEEEERILKEQQQPVVLEEQLMAQEEEKKLEAEVKKPAKKKKDGGYHVEKEEDLIGIGYFTEP